MFMMWSPVVETNLRHELSLPPLHRCISSNEIFLLQLPSVPSLYLNIVEQSCPFKRRRKHIRVPVKSHESDKKAPPRSISTNQLTQTISCSTERQTVDQWGARTAWQDLLESRSVARLDPDELSAACVLSLGLDSSPSTGHMCAVVWHTDCEYCYIQWNYHHYLLHPSIHELLHTPSDNNTSETLIQKTES